MVKACSQTQPSSKNARNVSRTLSGSSLFSRRKIKHFGSASQLFAAKGQTFALGRTHPSSFWTQSTPCFGRKSAGRKTCTRCKNPYWKRRSPSVTKRVRSVRQPKMACCAWCAAKTTETRFCYHASISCCATPAMPMARAPSAEPRLPHRFRYSFRNEQIQVRCLFPTFNVWGMHCGKSCPIDVTKTRGVGFLLLRGY